MEKKSNFYFPHTRRPLEKLLGIFLAIPSSVTRFLDIFSISRVYELSYRHRILLLILSEFKQNN